MRVSWSEADFTSNFQNAQMESIKGFSDDTLSLIHISAGLSLGEYCALYAAGAMTEKDAIATVRQRGILMQEAVCLLYTSLRWHLLRILI